LRGRLTLWHALITGLVLTAFAGLVYAALSRGLLAELDRSLQSQAMQVERGVRRELRESRARPITIPRGPSLGLSGTFVQVATADGRILGRSESLGGGALPLDPTVVSRLGPGEGTFSVAPFEGERLRQYTARLDLQGRAGPAVMVARSLAPVEAALSRLRYTAGAGLALALLLSGAGVWLASTRALRPLDQLVATAEAIGDFKDLSRRAPEPATSKEITRLTGAFNRMLDKLQSSDDELRAAHDQVADALDAQRRFVADASHELRTPLTTIRGNAALLRQVADVRPEDRTAALTQIGQEAERMSRLVADLLTLARADAGKSLQRTRVALAPLLRDVTAQARALASGRALELQHVEPMDVQGDPDALRQLALILLDNAVKYTPTGGAISVTLRPDGHAAELTVADNGLGISSEDLPHVFERFYRADRGRSTGGSGLGLSIARWIVEQHGGSIRVASTLGRGSTFTVRLPAAPRTPQVYDGRANGRGSLPTSNTNLSPS
jgi:signal transduction histidine kinase